MIVRSVQYIYSLPFLYCKTTDGVDKVRLGGEGSRGRFGCLERVLVASSI